MIGRHLATSLAAAGNEVRILSRSAPKDSSSNTFHWDPLAGEIDESALEGTHAIIHLAGAGIADKKWTRARKDLILDSRVKSANLLFSTLQESGHVPEVLVSASGIGYYGYDTGSILVKETSRFGDDFVATVVKKWEEAADQFEDLGTRVVKLRTGIVIASSGGALERMLPPVKMGIGSPLGRGDQYISWIHLDDLADIYNKAIGDRDMAGVYNAVSPNPATNKDFMKSLAAVVGRPFFLPSVPTFILKLILGEMASLVIGGNNVSAERLIASGFQFQHPDLIPALEDILKRG